MGIVDLDAPRAIAIRAIETLLAMMVGGGLLVVLLRVLGRRRASDADAPRAAPEVPLAKRYLTLMALIVLVIGPAFLGGWLFVASVLAVAALGARELFGAVDERSGSLRAPTIVATLAIVIAAAIGGLSTMGPALGLAFAFLATWALAQGFEHLAERMGVAALGLVYAGVTCAFMTLLRVGPTGFGRYLYFLVVVQMADLGGLFGGMAFGRHKLAPRLSPGKTWEGAVGSVVVAAGGGALFAFAVPELGLAKSAALAVPLAITGLVGDLFASGLKRSAGLKDFSAVLPGHGGILDRFDSYLVAAPVAWALFALVDRLR
jgi:phosphatidate cytidylyltransferase